MCDVCERVHVRSGNNTQHMVAPFAVRMMCEQLIADRYYYHEIRALLLKVPVAWGQRMRSKRMRTLPVTTNAK